MIFLAIMAIVSLLAADLLRLEGSSAEDIEKLAINELFEVIWNLGYKG